MAVDSGSSRPEGLILVAHRGRPAELQRALVLVMYTPMANVALVTGSARGIGAVTAGLAASRGLAREVAAEAILWLLSD